MVHTRALQGTELANGDLQSRGKEVLRSGSRKQLMLQSRGSSLQIRIYKAADRPFQSCTSKSKFAQSKNKRVKQNHTKSRPR